MFRRQTQLMRLVSSLLGACLVLLFSAFGHINAVDNLQHLGNTPHHEHSVLGLGTMIEDHEHHAVHDHDGKGTLSPADHPEHAHPNVLGTAAPNDIEGFDTPSLGVAAIRLIPPRAEAVTGHIQQTPDRPPKTRL
jgi:hypothetical protein